MSIHDDPNTTNYYLAGSSAATATLTTDIDNPTPGVGFGVSAITRRWKREDLLKTVYLIATGLAFLFSLLSFIIVASNKRGEWKNFDQE